MGRVLYFQSVRIQKAIFTPVFGGCKQPIAVVGIAWDFTSFTDLLYLFKVYKNYYSKKAATQYLSKYLKLEPYFHESLNCCELSTLLALVQTSSRKEISRVLDLLPITINNYLNILRSKLKTNIDLDIVVSVLKGFQRWTPTLENF